MAGPCAGREIVQSPGDVQEIPRTGVTEHRHDQLALESRGHADVDRIEDFERRIGPTAIGFRDLTNRIDRCLQKIGSERQGNTLTREQIPMARAMRQNR